MIYWRTHSDFSLLNPLCGPLILALNIALPRTASQFSRYLWDGTDHCKDLDTHHDRPTSPTLDHASIAATIIGLPARSCVAVQAGC